MRVAILSLQSHGDRSFLDDRELANLSGVLTEGGVDNDLVVCVLDPRGEGADFDDAMGRLTEVLRSYDVVVYERVWDRRIVARLRDALPARFVCCIGEHELLDPPADFLCRGELSVSVPALLAFLDGSRATLPEDAAAAGEDGGFRFASPTLTRRETVPRARPNLRPVVVNPEALPSVRTFSIVGNPGCPYQVDARDNPLYAGVTIPSGYGRGCAFCTTGNHYQALPAEEVVGRVIDQIRHVRATAPELTLLVLKDQNPFGYLETLVRACAEEGLGGFTLLLETRADWFLRSRARVERALSSAATADIRMAPFLVGIESFSPDELERFNKGSTAETNEAFLALLDELDAAHDALDLTHASFGFVLLTPWTTLRDLRINYDAIVRTGLWRRRGQLLLSRARLYPDTALYYLAQRDGLLADAHRSKEDDASARYGYYPSHPWRFAHPEVARFAEIAATLTRERDGRDEPALFRALLEVFEAAADPSAVEVEDVRRASADPGVVAPVEASDMHDRLGRLVEPLPIDGEFAGRWTFGELHVRPGRLRVQLQHPSESPFALDIVADDGGPAFSRSRHYALRHVGTEQLSPGQEQALSAVCAAIVANDA